MTVLAARTDVPAEYLRRIFAGSAVVILLLLSVATASPAVHQWLHGDNTPDSSDSCAVVHFATGLTVAVAAIVVAAPGVMWHEQPTAVVAKIYLASPRYLRQPERGPPLC